MWRMKNNDLEARIGIPDGFKVKGEMAEPFLPGMK